MINEVPPIFARIDRALAECDARQLLPSPQPIRPSTWWQSLANDRTLGERPRMTGGNVTNSDRLKAALAEQDARAAFNRNYKVIWKFPLASGPIGQYARITDLPLSMPKYSVIVHIGHQAGCPMLWAMVDPQQQYEIRRFQIVATGQPIPPASPENYCGTVQMPDGTVWHIIEATPTGPPAD